MKSYFKPNFGFIVFIKSSGTPKLIRKAAQTTSLIDQLGRKSQKCVATTRGPFESISRQTSSRAFDIKNKLEGQS